MQAWQPYPVDPYSCYMCYHTLTYLIMHYVTLFWFWFPYTAINVSIQYNGGLLPDIILAVDPMILIIIPSGNPFKRHEEVLSLQAYDTT